MRNGKELGQQILVAVKDYVARASASLSSRLDEFEKRLNGIPIPRDGIDGKSVTIEDVEPVLAKFVADAVLKITIPTPKDGENGRNAYEVAQSLGYEGTVHQWMDSLVGQKGEKGDPGESIKGEKGDPGESIKGDPGADGKSVTIDDVRPLIEESVKAIPTPKDGLNGKDGTSVTVEQVMPELKAELQKAIDAIPAPKDGRDGGDGKDGKDGVDGKSVTIEDIQKAIEFEHTKFWIGFERNARDLIQKLFESVPKPKDGMDGLGFDDFQVTYDGERTVTHSYKLGERTKELVMKLPCLIDQGVYREGKLYERGDGVTCGGSFWIAQKETTLRPGDGNSDWRLAVKKGRDGKDAGPQRQMVR